MMIVVKFEEGFNENKKDYHWPFGSGDGGRHSGLVSA